MQISFLLNGEMVDVSVTDPTQTLLDWLREARGLTGTKEGCNEGDCGACSVAVTDEKGGQALNACILFLPQLQGKAVRTVEGIAASDGTLHPVQQAMIDHHGSQCGFCTPGFITTMAVAHLNGTTDHATELAGNLCRCTGYAPILRAAEAASAAPVPAHMHEPARPKIPLTQPQNDMPWVAPTSGDALAAWLQDHPDTTLIAGATDVGLWVTKDFRDLGKVAFLNQCTDLKGIEMDADTIRIGAMATLSEVEAALSPLYPSLGALLRRYGSRQVRNAATLGGNIANGSPIGDGSPALIALGATLHLRKGNTRRDLALEAFFLDYGKQDLSPGEFIEAVSFPRAGDHLSCAKLSKRVDQDISAVCGCFWIKRDAAEMITEARLAFGGMAGIPMRAARAEAAMLNHPWTEATVRAAMAALPSDFTPLSDMRASAGYRMTSAQNMLLRAFAERNGESMTLAEFSL